MSKDKGEARAEWLATRPFNERRPVVVSLLFAAPLLVVAALYAATTGIVAIPVVLAVCSPVGAYIFNQRMISDQRKRDRGGYRRTNW